MHLQIFSIFQSLRNSFTAQTTSAFSKFIFLDFSQHLDIQTVLERFYIPIISSAPLLFKNSFIGRTIDHSQAFKNLSTISSAYHKIDRLIGMLQQQGTDPRMVRKEVRRNKSTRKATGKQNLD